MAPTDQLKLGWAQLSWSVGASYGKNMASCKIGLITKHSFVFCSYSLGTFETKVIPNLFSTAKKFQNFCFVHIAPKNSIWAPTVNFQPKWAPLQKVISSSTWLLSFCLYNPALWIQSMCNLKWVMFLFNITTIESHSYQGTFLREREEESLHMGWYG